MFESISPYPGGYDEPTQPCPYCDTEMMCDWVDVGVGSVQCGPYHCENCHASEIGPEQLDDPNFNPTEEERKTGFYKGGKHSPYANTVHGRLVDHKAAKKHYVNGTLDEKPEPEK